MDSYIVRAIGSNRGARRIYIDGAVLARSQFVPGTTFDIEACPSKRTLILHRRENGSRVVSKKRKHGSQDVAPVIDINSNGMLSTLGAVMVVRITISALQITITPLASELSRLDRLERLSRSVDAGRLQVGSIAHGIGVLAHTAHQGLKRAELDADLAVAVEINADWLNQAIEHNPAWSSKTVAVAAPMQEYAQDPQSRGFKVDVVELGIPCSGASVAGKAKRGLKRMESHPEVGHLVVPALMLIAAWNPAAVVLENVKSYSNEASADLLRSMLADMGYHVQETCLTATYFGELERRERWFLVAVTRGIAFDINSVTSDIHERYRQVRYVSEVLEDVADDSPEWSRFDYLQIKAERDAQKGSCFALQTVDESDIEVPTLRKGYQKAGSTDPLLAHPTKPGLKRRFSVVEHARLKGQPDCLVKGMGIVDGHAAMGQSVCFEPVARLFEELGKALRHWASTAHADSSPKALRYSVATATG
ncbi:hypothetical protein JY96_21340 [Aquabacterium sp. NJ1]|uniref:DNA cytosine methyltransferase n=1 Tax=Aquabacterium sp. NJ1 TaxID=1538295 RepID=UPI00052BF57B|nr:DNA cytosine methyltransferase [Aquabacterium sp. NJ1]KGM38720.1 hypothetical protein JY96_21340 [Aquabacterium sp. NJ1]